ARRQLVCVALRVRIEGVEEDLQGFLHAAAFRALALLLVCPATDYSDSRVDCLFPLAHPVDEPQAGSALYLLVVGCQARAWHAVVADAVPEMVQGSTVATGVHAAESVVVVE